MVKHALAVLCLVGCNAAALPSSAPTVLTGNPFPSGNGPSRAATCSWSASGEFDEDGADSCTVYLAEPAPPNGSPKFTAQIIMGSHVVEIDFGGHPFVTYDGIEPTCLSSWGTMHVEVTAHGWTVHSDDSACSPSEIFDAQGTFAR